MSYSNTTTPPLSQPTNQRALLDVNYIVTTTYPNAANQVNSSGLDLVQAVPYPTTDRIDVNITGTAGVGANNKNVNFWLQESADNGNWTNMAYMNTSLLQTVDNGNTNTNTGNVTVHLQPGCLRYIRLATKGEANGGAGTNGVATLQLLF